MARIDKAGRDVRLARRAREADAHVFPTHGAYPCSRPVVRNCKAEQHGLPLPMSRLQV